MNELRDMIKYANDCKDFGECTGNKEYLRRADAVLKDIEGMIGKPCQFIEAEGGYCVDVL